MRSFFGEVEVRQGRTAALRQDGAVAIEFVLLFPIFILVMLGALYFAFAFNTQRALVFVAQSGADAALRVDRSQFDLSQAGGITDFKEKIRERACGAMEPLLKRQSKTVIGTLPQECSEDANEGVSFEWLDAEGVVIITVTAEPAWRPPLVGQFITTISGSASVPL